MRVLAHALWVHKSHLELRWGYHGALLGGLGGYLGARWGQLVPCRSHLEVILGELGGYLAPPWVHKSGAKWKLLIFGRFYKGF